MGNAIWQLNRDPDSVHWKERRRLASNLRSLITHSLLSTASESVITRVADELGRLAALLGEDRGPTFFEAVRDGTWEHDSGIYADRNFMLGVCNPLAPPMTVSEDGDGVRGLVNLSYAYEGPPGAAHGGVVAALLDQIFGSLMVRAGIPCMTGKLTIRYHKPTPLEKDLVLHAEQVKIDGKSVHCRGELRAQETLIASADCMMVKVGDEALAALFKQIETDKAREQARLERESK